MVSPASDPRVLRAIAHPVRNRILLELEAGGPARAADLARALGIPANQASFHLRQLAKYAVIEEAPDRARDRRDRVWRVAGEGSLDLDLTALAEAPGGQAAVSVWARHGAARAHELVESVYGLTRDEGTTSAIVESSVRLTRDEAKELVSEIDRLLEGWVACTRADGAGGGGGGRDREARRQTYQFLMLLKTYPALAGSTPGGEDAGEGAGEDAGEDATGGDGGAGGAGDPGAAGVDGADR